MNEKDVEKTIMAQADAASTKKKAKILHRISQMKCCVRDSLNELSDSLFQLSRLNGWHDDCEYDGCEEHDINTMGKLVMNVVAEAAELWEAVRAGTVNSQCDKAGKMKEAGIEPLTCIEEECADIIIRVLDLCGRYKIKIGEAVLAKAAFNATRPPRHGDKKA